MRELLSIRQKEHQSYTELCNEIRELGEYADTAAITEDRLHIGLLLQAMKNESDKAKLMSEDPATFNRARDYILGLETARKGAKQMGQTTVSSGVKEINAAKSSTYKKSKYGDKNGKKTGQPWLRSNDDGRKADNSNSSKCERCNGQNHLSRECPAREQTCINCNRTGHFSSACRSKPSQRTAALHLNEVQINAIDGNKNKLQVSIVTDSGFKTKVKALPDTGADISVMGAGIFNKAGISKRVQLGPCLNQELLAVANTPLAQAGTFNATIRVAGQEVKDITVVVCSEVKDFYLGLDVCKSLNIVGKNFPCPMTTKVAKIECEKKPSVKTSETPEVWPDRQEWILTLPEETPGPEIMKMVEDKLHEIYAEIFNDSEELKPMTGHEVGEPMRIILKSDAKPFAVNAPRQIPYALRDKVKEALQYMVERGIIEKLGDVPTSTLLHLILFI